MRILASQHRDTLTAATWAVFDHPDLAAATNADSDRLETDSD